jgi:hypothetical protein
MKVHHATCVLQQWLAFLLGFSQVFFVSFFSLFSFSYNPNKDA